MAETAEYRARRIWLHGARAFERVSAGAAVFQSAVPAGAEGDVRAKCRSRQNVRRQLGLRVGRDRTGARSSSGPTSISSTSPARTTRIAEIAIAAARAGKMVLCEKPLGRNGDEAKRMVDAVESAGVPNMVWYNYRRVPAVTMIKSARR